MYNAFYAFLTIQGFVCLGPPMLGGSARQGGIWMVEHQLVCGEEGRGRVRGFQLHH